MIQMSFCLEKNNGQNFSVVLALHGGMNINNAEEVLSRNRCLISRNCKPPACITVCSAVAYLAQPINILSFLSSVLVFCLTLLFHNTNFNLLKQSLYKVTALLQLWELCSCVRGELCSPELRMRDAICGL